MLMKGTKDFRIEEKTYENERGPFKKDAPNYTKWLQKVAPQMGEVMAQLHKGLMRHLQPNMSQFGISEDYKEVTINDHTDTRDISSLSKGQQDFERLDDVRKLILSVYKQVAGVSLNTAAFDYYIEQFGASERTVVGELVKGYGDHFGVTISLSREDERKLFELIKRRENGWNVGMFKNDGIAVGEYLEKMEKAHPLIKPLHFIFKYFINTRHRYHKLIASPLRCFRVFS